MRKLLLLILLCSIYLQANAQLLYEISGNNSQSKSYMLATNKLSDISFLDTIPNLFKVFGRCDKVITEMALSTESARQALQTASVLPDSISLRDIYSLDEYKTISDAVMLTMGLSLDKLSRIKPSYLTEMYRNELLKRWLAYDENRSSEIFFQAIAEERGLPVIALDETGEALFMLFDREPLTWQTKELLKIVEFPERETRQERRILELYKLGQLNEISYQVAMPDNQSTLSYSDYQIFCRRNPVWVKRLAPYLTEGNAFICLNCIYLGGEEGLIAQLRKAGYKVRAVNKRI